jgi:ParB-like chromosome segregation protein Spo0J
LKSLIVRKVESGEYAVVDGGLRLRALQRLAKKGTLKKNLPIACSVLSGKANATEISTGTNMHAPMHSVDKFEASKEHVEKGIPASAHAYSPMVPVRKGPLGR